MKKTFSIIFCLIFSLAFSGCTSGVTSTSSTTTVSKKFGNFLKSFDGGKNWETKVKIDESKNIGLTNILSMEIDPMNSSIIYIGTEKDGLYVTKDGAENWEKLVFPLGKIYGLAIDNSNNQIIYATGVLNSRAKIFKSMNAGKEWQEIYTEPANDSVISSLEISKKNSKVLYCGTSEGMIFKTVDGGQSWKNLEKANGPIIDITFDSENEQIVYFAVSKGTIFRTMDGGVKFEDLGKMDISKIATGKSLNLNTYSIETDPGSLGVLYVGTDSGMLRGSEFGEKWEEINILESSKKFPVRSITINPKNSNEILYSSSGVIYRSLDRGINWFTFQLNTENSIQVMEYDWANPGNIYAGLRKI